MTLSARMVYPQAIPGNQGDHLLNEVPEWSIPILNQMACLISNMGHISVIHKKITFNSDVFLLQFCQNLYLDMQQNLTKQQNFSFK